jgi:hypothetical protein
VEGGIEGHSFQVLLGAKGRAIVAMVRNYSDSGKQTAHVPFSAKQDGDSKELHPSGRYNPSACLPRGQKMPNADKKACFVIAPIGEKNSDFRKHSDQVLKYIIKAALSDVYEVTRGDEISEPGMITSQVLQAVQDSSLVVADLTWHNPNVFYELAVRHAIEKPVIHLIDRRISKIPFDVGGFRTIEFDITDLESVESAVSELKKQAQAGKWGETPIKIAQVMRPGKGDSPELVLLKQVMEGISEMAASLARIERPTALYATGKTARLLDLISRWDDSIGNSWSYPPPTATEQRLVEHTMALARKAEKAKAAAIKGSEDKGHHPGKRIKD